MKVALLQEERYRPSFHGSNKSNRCLLESLAREGHECLALCSASPPEAHSFDGIEVRGMPPGAGHEERSAFLFSILKEFEPDIILVSSSKHTYALSTALRLAANRVVYLVHNHEALPLDMLRGARAVVAVSGYSREYLRTHAGIEAVRLRFPVYGEGPYPNFGCFDRGSITLIKSSPGKGVDVFLDLASLFPEQQFATVRWSADKEALARMAQLGNVTVWDPHENIEEILRRTKILLAPSKEPDTFGLIVPEAMLRGIPVLASNLGGLPEAKLGIDYLLPIDAGLTRWSETLGRLLSDGREYERCSEASCAAAAHFVAEIDVRPFEDLFRTIRPNGRSRAVAVVDPFDAGYLLAQELVRREYSCTGVVSGEYIDSEITEKCPPGFLANAIRHRGNVAETAAALRSEGIGCVLPGCETGVNLCDALSEALDFCSNGIALSAARRNKFLMAEAVRNKGTAVPEQIYSERLEELMAWVKNHSRWPVVAKPAESLASEGVRLCRSEDELAEAFHSVVGRRNIAGAMNRGLIAQEPIDATQYVVDTVSYRGRHYLSGIWRYGRPEFASDVLRALAGEVSWPSSAGNLTWPSLRYGAISSVSKQILPGEGEVAGTLFEYAVQVLDALGIQYGPCHFELMWTDQGVRLVEVGARVHGAPHTHSMNRMCTGVSQVDQTIDLYLDPARFLRDARTSYKLRWEGMMCRLIPWREGVFRGFHGLQRIERMRSFHRSFGMADPGERVPGCLGVAMLLHPDEDVLRRDYEAIRQLEKEDLYSIGED
jgi:biotin carboxylase/glycosyltransferase involved in cell wall biosynthesis